MKTRFELNATMQLTPIQMESYAGFKADDTPRRFLAEDRWIEVEEVLDRWYKSRAGPSGRRRIISRCEEQTSMSIC